MGNAEQGRLTAKPPGLSPPIGSETAHVASAGRIEEQGNTNEIDCVAEPVADQVIADAPEHKIEVNMQARATLAGCGLYRLADGSFLLTKWSMAKSCPDLRSVGALLNRLVGTP
ncbi:MAG: hypothetical protein ABL916_07485 [Burkholderiaceae bacterium]